jgi:transposase-like protein
MTVRRTAQALNVSVSTAFRWRHRFLEAMSEMNPQELSGIVEADETFFRESFQGKRKDMPRESKSRGEPAAQRGLSREQIPALVARDRSTGKTLTMVLPTRTAKDIWAVLVPALAPDAVLCSDNASAYRTLAKAAGIELRCVPANPKKKGKGEVYHIQNVNAYDSRLKGWMFRFRGVATKNLSNYLGWHRYLDVPKTRPTPRKFLTGRWGISPGH